jgi:hypothetical protein
MMEKYNPGLIQVALVGQLSYAQTDFIAEKYNALKNVGNAREFK